MVKWSVKLMLKIYHHKK